MPSFVFSPLARIGAVAALVLALLVYRGVLVHQRDRARAELAAAVQRCAGLEAANASLAQEIRTQNAAVEAMRTAAEHQAQAMGARMRDSARAADRAQSRAEADAGALARLPIAAGCEQAIEWGRERARELGRW